MGLRVADVDNGKIDDASDWANAKAVVTLEGATLDQLVEALALRCEGLVLRGFVRGETEIQPMTVVKGDPMMTYGMAGSLFDMVKHMTMAATVQGQARQSPILRPTLIPAPSC